MANHASQLYFIFFIFLLRQDIPSRFAGPLFPQNLNAAQFLSCCHAYFGPHDFTAPLSPDDTSRHTHT